MTTILQLIRIEMKRAIKSLPQLILGAIVLSVMIGTIAFCSGKFLYGKGPLAKVSIGLVVDNNSTNINWVVDFMSHMKSTENMFDFQMETKENAYVLLENNDISAIMMIPDDVLGSIMDGTNHHVQVIFSKSSSISNILLQELSRSGAKILSSAQASIYTITDLYIEYGLSSYLNDTQLALNITNLQYALMRDELFRTSSTSTTGAVSVVSYYVASGILLFLLLWGTTYSYFLKKDSPPFQQKLTCLGIHSTSYILIKLFVTFTTYFLSIGFLLSIVTIYMKIVWNFNIIFSMMTILSVFIIILCISTFILLLFEFAPTPTSGILLLFIMSILLIFLSGGFIPSAFFPNNLRHFSDYLPTTYLRNEIIHVLISKYEASNLVPLVLYTIVFLLLTIAIHHRRRVSRS
ncbi:MAG TPA: ABC transporter permease [Lachnospiraceae bacterium]|nr:ABC transporter permease [Lachnospiraceae bacterium]